MYVISISQSLDVKTNFSFTSPVPVRSIRMFPLANTGVEWQKGQMHNTLTARPKKQADRCICATHCPCVFTNDFSVVQR